MAHNRKYLFAVALLILFTAMLICVKTVDVAPIGPEHTTVGLSTLNHWFAEQNRFRHAFYMAANLCGYLAFAVSAYFAMIGLKQLIRRRSLWKVDRSLLLLAGLYLTMAIMYILFEKWVINYRPVILTGDTAPKPSFPSTHTMLSIVIYGSAFLLIPKYVHRKTIQRCLRTASLLLLVATVVFRLLSGAHWLTDIFAGGLLGGSMLLFFYALCGSEKRDPE